MKRIICSSSSKKDQIESILDTNLTNDELQSIAEDWKAFYTNPEQYKNSIVVDMVREYLDN